MSEYPNIEKLRQMVANHKYKDVGWWNFLRDLLQEIEPLLAQQPTSGAKV
jgi:hypothetical protein